MAESSHGSGTFETMNVPRVTRLLSCVLPRRKTLIDSKKWHNRGARGWRQHAYPIWREHTEAGSQNERPLPVHERVLISQYLPLTRIHYNASGIPRGQSSRAREREREREKERAVWYCSMRISIHRHVPRTPPGVLSPRILTFAHLGRRIRRCSRANGQSIKGDIAKNRNPEW